MESRSRPFFLTDQMVESRKRDPQNGPVGERIAMVVILLNKLWLSGKRSVLFLLRFFPFLSLFLPLSLVFPSSIFFSVTSLFERTA